MVLFLPEQSLELLLALQLVLLYFLELLVELSSSLACLIIQSLLFRLKFADLLSEIVPFFLDLGEFLAGLGLHFLELLRLVRADRVILLLNLLELHLGLLSLAASHIFGVHQLNFVDLRACDLPLQLFKLLLELVDSLLQGALLLRTTLLEQLLIALFRGLLLNLGNLERHLGIDHFLPQLACHLAQVVNLCLQVSHVVGCLHLLELSDALEIPSLCNLLLEALDLTGLGLAFRLKLERHMLKLLNSLLEALLLRAELALELTDLGSKLADDCVFLCNLCFLDFRYLSWCIPGRLLLREAGTRSCIRLRLSKRLVRRQSCLVHRLGQRRVEHA